MSLIKDKLPHIHAASGLKAFHWDPPDGLLTDFAAIEPPKAMEEASATTIDILDEIGESPWGDGVSEKHVAKRLDAVRGKDVKVRINSPGGDLLAGISIFNLLRAHDAKVTVDILGMAASSASIIAMAADEIVMGMGSTMMIHNCWGLAIGNRHDLTEVAGIMEGLDGAMAKIYVARTGRSKDEISSLMDAETYMQDDQAVEQKFADRVDGEVSVNAKMKIEEAEPLTARRRVEAALARAGVPRKDRAVMISQANMLGGPRDATTDNPAERDAGFTADWLESLCNGLKTL